MARYKPQDRNALLLPVVLSEQIIPGSFAFALDYLVDHELDLSALDARFSNDQVGASAYDPRVMLKIVLLAYSQGLVSSRAIERSCIHNVQFIALSGDSQPSHAHIAKFVSSLADQIKPLFAQVLLTCDAQGLIGRDLFAIDGVKLPSNASKERSGTHVELRHRAQRLDKAAAKIIALHQSADNSTQDEPLDAKRTAQLDKLRKEASRTREFLTTQAPRLNAKGQELKTNITDPDSAKMATSKGVIQGYAAQAAVDSHHQIIVAAEVIGSGSEQSMLPPMVEQSQPAAHTVITADAGYFSDANLNQLMAQGTPALIADPQMRQRDERLEDQDKHKAKDDPLYDKQPTGTGRLQTIKLFTPQDFAFNKDNTSCICPAGCSLTGSASVYADKRGQRFQRYSAQASDCQGCDLRKRCMRNPESKRGRQVNRFEPKLVDPDSASERMRRAIDSPRGRQLYSQRLGTVEPVFANLRHNKRLTRFNLRGKAKVNAQWHLYCLVHNIEKLAHSGWRGVRRVERQAG
jgi:transposase